MPKPPAPDELIFKVPEFSHYSYVREAYDSYEKVWLYRFVGVGQS